MKKKIYIILLCMMIVLVGCSKSQKTNDTNNNKNILESSYDEILESAKGTTVNFYGYGGNEVMNKWFDSYVIPQMKEKYDIKVNRIGMNIDDIMNKLLSEKQANIKDGVMDVIWINGENFKTAKENNLLLGSFTEKLPNFNDYVNKNSETINTDFGTSVDGLEAPWGKAEFVVIKDSSKVTQNIEDTETLKEAIIENPGKFTYPALPDFEGSAFVRNVIYDIVGYENLINLSENEDEVRKVIQPAMDYLNEIKPYLWNKGETYPATIGQLDNMYSDGEVYFTMSYSPNTVKGKIDSNEYSKDTEIISFDKGNISNTHFLTIPENAPNKEAAMVLINFLMSIDAQASKTDTDNWGDMTVLDMNKVPDEEKSKFSENVELEKTLPELNAGLIPIIEKIWSEEVLQNGK